MMQLSECKESVLSFAEREHHPHFDGKGTTFSLNGQEIFGTEMSLFGTLGTMFGGASGGLSGRKKPRRGLRRGNILRSQGVWESPSARNYHAYACHMLSTGTEKWNLNDSPFNA